MKLIICDPTVLKAHIHGYTRKDGTFVAAHEDSRNDAVDKGHSMPSDAAPVVRSFVVHKVGRKWLEVTHPGKTFKMQLAITPQTAHLQEGDQINDMPVGEVKNQSKFGTSVTYYPMSKESFSSAKEKEAEPQIEKWIGYVEDSAKKGSVYQNGIDKLRQLGAFGIPKFKQRIDAAIASANSKKNEEEIKRWSGYVSDAAKEGKTYYKGVYTLQKLGVSKDKIDELLKPIQEEKERERAEAQKQIDDEKAKGIKRRSFWGQRGGFGAPHVGQVIRDGEGYAKVTEVSDGKYFGEDASSFGGNDDNRWQYTVKTRPATPEESAPLIAEEKKAELKRSGKMALSAIAADFSKNGVRPESADPSGDVVFNNMDIYGGGEKFVIGKDKIWHIQNNGGDGDYWGANNVRTGGAGAIGRYLPKTHALEHKIRQAAANFKGDDYEIPPEPKKPTDPWTDEQWQKLLLDESNTNARTHNKILAEMRKLAAYGDVEGLKRMKHGINTYGRKRSIIAQHLLTAMGDGVFAKAMMIIVRV